MPTPYRYLCCGDLSSPGVMEWCNGPRGLHDDDDYDDDDDGRKTAKTILVINVIRECLKSVCFFFLSIFYMLQNE